MLRHNKGRDAEIQQNIIFIKQQLRAYKDVTFNG